MCENKTGVKSILVIFQDRHLFNQIIQKVSARDFFIDEAEQKSIMKNYENVYHPRLIFTPKTGDNSLKQVFRLSCEAGSVGSSSLIRGERGSLTSNQVEGEKESH